MLKRLEAEEKTKSSLYIAHTRAHGEKAQMYEVIEVGPGGMVDGKEVAMCVKKGNKVLVGKYTGTKVKVDGEEYDIVHRGDILAIIED